MNLTRAEYITHNVRFSNLFLGDASRPFASGIPNEPLFSFDSTIAKFHGNGIRFKRTEFDHHDSYYESEMGKIII